jgi:uncharacterized protein YqgC (DUF456 family)
MEIILAVLAFLFLLAGLLGSVVPAIPGPPLSYAGLLLLKWSGYAGFSVTFLIVWAAITVVVTIMDNFLPAWLTKKFGGSRLAVIGSVLGLVSGMIFFAPIGLIVGPFLGALAGELINNRFRVRRNKIENADPETANIAHNNNPLKVALGAFLAFIVGTGAKLIIGSLMIFYAVKAVL